MAVTELLPNRTDVEVETQPELVTAENADDVLDVLSTDSAREILRELQDSPAPMSDLAADLDMSLQNVEYHLQRLEEANLVESVDTWYSSKGTEMTVYAPASNPIVVFGGDEPTRSVLSQAVEKLRPDV